MMSSGKRQCTVARMPGTQCSDWSSDDWSISAGSADADADDEEDEDEDEDEDEEAAPADLAALADGRRRRFWSLATVISS
jgi:hypothetical protein